MSSNHCFFAGYCDEVVCDCESVWMRLSEIKNVDSAKGCFPEANTILKVMFLKSDLFFQHSFDLNTTFVCQAHYKMLLQPSYVRGKSVCDVCEYLRKDKSKNKGSLRNITIAQSITLFEVFRVKHSYGKLICRQCRDEVVKKQQLGKIDLHIDAFACVLDSESFCCKKNKDPDYQPFFDSQVVDGEDENEKVKEQREVLNKLLDVFRSRKRILCTESYKSLSHRVKLRYINMTKFLLTSITSFIAKGDGKMLMHDSCKGLISDDSNLKLDGNFCQVLTGISEAYNIAESWQSRREILSIVAPKVSLKTLQLFLPGLTEFRYSAARFHATKYGIGSKIEEKVACVQRFSDCQIAHFVDFIISPHVCVDLPFGEKTLKLSSGTELYVPNTIRNMGLIRIIEQYLLYCKEMYVDFEPLSKSSLFTILDVCKASTRKSLQGIDYFAADASEAFEGIKKMIEEHLYSSNDSNRLVENLKRARLYLKTDYKVHVTRSSSIADHCCSYALSDSTKKCFVADCDHEHNETCLECVNMTSTLDEVEYALKNLEIQNESLDRLLNKFRLYRTSIEAWKAHLLRCFNQDLCRENILDNLKNDEIYINLDWAMKFLPLKSREPQSDFFGKRGISWHISVVMKNRTKLGETTDFFNGASKFSTEDQQIDEKDVVDEGEEIDDDGSFVVEVKNKHFEYRVFVHVFDECSQDSEVVQGILKDVLKRVKYSNPEVTKAFLRSDNAGCYHSANTILSGVQLSNLTGIKIKRIDFSDPQGGKGACDRYAAVIKSNVRRYLNENHDVTNASEFVVACHSYKGVKGVLALNCKIENEEEVYKHKKRTINLITQYNNFEYKTDGLLVYRSWNIGTGLLLYWSKLGIDIQILDIVSDKNEFHVHDWVYTEERYECEKMDVNDCDTSENEEFSNKISQNKLYACDVEEGCTAEFVKYGNLINHILLGKHCRSIERASLKDTAMSMYFCKLEQVGNRHMISVDLSRKETNTVEKTSLSKGWALPVRKLNKGFSLKQREYLEAKFNEGVVGIRHWKPKDVVADMENLRIDNKFYFSATEILNENQIRSFFSRMKQEKHVNVREVAATTPMEIDDSVVDDLSKTDNQNNDDLDSDLEGWQDLRDIEVAIEETVAIANSILHAKNALTTSGVNKNM